MNSQKLKEIEDLLSGMAKDISEADSYAAYIRGRTRHLAEDLQNLTDLTVSLDKYVRGLHISTNKLRSLLSKIDRE